MTTTRKELLSLLTFTVRGIFIILKHGTNIVRSR